MQPPSFDTTAIGRLVLDDGGVRIATVVRRNTLMTAAKCVFDDDGALRPVAQMRLHPGLGQDGAAVSHRITKLSVPAKYAPLDPMTQRKLAHDAALLHLAPASGAGQIAPITIKSASTAPARTYLVQLVQNADGMPPQVIRCDMLRRPPGSALMFDCLADDVPPGTPLLIVDQGRPHLVSMLTSGGYAKDGTEVRLGPNAHAMWVHLLGNGRATISGPLADVRRMPAGKSNPGRTGAKTARPDARNGIGAKFIRAD